MDATWVTRTPHEDTKWKGLRRLKLFFALSRTPHGLLDMATPGLAALLWLGTFPPPITMALGLMTVFAGYTAVYALNDVVDFRSDREKIQRGGFQDSENYLDAAILRHPLAHGLLNFNEALIWVIFWGLLALSGAYLLNPFCLIIFAAGCLLEILYCLMWKISPFRVLISGVVKTCGPLAAVFAVDPNPSLSLLATLFFWLFFWEMGGQNIPNDWAEIEEDRLFNAKTVLVRYGPSAASAVVLGSLSLTVTISFFLFQQRLGLASAMAALLAGMFLLLPPAFTLFRKKSRSHALVLFNRASYYPLVLLFVVTARILLTMD
jgi:4-hydroxybenzoate polyprenyltransferase